MVMTTRRKSQEANEVSYKEKNIGPITIRREVGTTTSNDKSKYYKYAKGPTKRHQSDSSTESDCSSNQIFDTNIPDHRKTQKKTQPNQQQSGQQNLHPFNRTNHQIKSRLYTEEINRQQTTTVMIYNQQTRKATIIKKSTPSD